MAHRTGSRTLGLCLVLLLLCSVFLPFAAAGAETSAGEVPDAMLDTGPEVDKKMKSLAAGSFVDYMMETDDIKAIRMADALPADFAPSEANTVSAADSAAPVYIFFDNTDGAGIMYFYTESGTVAMNPASEYLFTRNTGLTDISGVAGWDCSRVKIMHGMFSRDLALADVTPLAGWDTSNAEDMSSLFVYMLSLTDTSSLKNWNTSKVTNMRSMYSMDSALLFADVSGWDTGNVVTMASMFQVGDSHSGNGLLQEIVGLGDLDVSNVTDMTCMFYGAGEMTHYDVSRWNVSKVESMNHMFCDNYKLKSLDLSKWDVSSVKTIYSMFDDCHKLKTVGDVSRWNTASLIDAGGWLNDSWSFVGDNFGHLDLSGWDTHNLKSAGEMFLRTKIRTIDLSGWTFESVTNETWEGWGRGIWYEIGNSGEILCGFGQMFNEAAELTEVTVSRAGLDSFNAAVENGVNTLDMWTGTRTEGFTVR